MDIVHVDFTTGEAFPALEPLDIVQHRLRVNRAATALNDEMADLDSFEAIVRAAWAHGMTATEFMPVIDEAIARARETRAYLMKYVTEDEKEFADFDEAVAHEKSLPFLRLLNEVEEMAAKNTEFSLRLESLGRRLEKARLARPDGRLRAPKKGARPDAGSRERPNQSDAADGLPATNEEIQRQLEGESHEPINRNLPR